MEWIIESLNGVNVDENCWEITLSNGSKIEIAKDAVRGDSVWNWNIAGQYFDNSNHAKNYLERVILEALTGKRVIFRAKGRIPEICGIEGAACRCPGECNSALCLTCPVAEEFFAQRDGVELIYAATNEVCESEEESNSKLLEGETK